MEELKNKLIKDVNESGLTIDAVYYIVKDFYRDVVETYQNYLNQQMAKAEQQPQEEEVKSEEDAQ